MKKILATLLCLTLFATAAHAASTFTTDTVANVTLHTYQSDDPMGDTSFIIESENELVVLEPQAFEKNVDEFQAYTQGLNKPVTQVLVAFHAAGLTIYERATKVITKPMNDFMNSEAGQGMLKYFGNAFKGAMDVRMVEFDKVIPANDTFAVDGVTYKLMPTSLPGMPGANIIINDEILFQHFVPAQNTHPSPFNIASMGSIAGALKDAQMAQDGGYSILIGSHYPGRATQDDLAFQIEYLKTLEQVAAKATAPAEVVSRMQGAYPDSKGEEHLKAYAEKLFQK